MTFGTEVMAIINIFDGMTSNLVLADVAETCRWWVDFLLHLDDKLKELASVYSVWTHLILFAVIFCETGLVVTPILPGDSGAWNPNDPSGRPNRYAYIPEGKFALHRVPDKVYSLTATVVIQPKDEVAQIPSEPLKKYSTGFEAGALMHLLRIPGQPWTDQALASKVYEPIWNSSISNGKAEAQRNYNSGSQRVKPRAFVTGR